MNCLEHIFISFCNNNVLLYLKDDSTLDICMCRSAAKFDFFLILNSKYVSAFIGLCRLNSYFA